MRPIASRCSRSSATMAGGPCAASRSATRPPSRSPSARRAIPSRRPRCSSSRCAPGKSPCRGGAEDSRIASVATKASPPRPRRDAAAKRCPASRLPKKPARPRRPAWRSGGTVLAGTEVVEPRIARRQLHLGIRELALKHGNGGREVALLALCESDATVDVGPDRGMRARLGPAHVADVPFTQGSAIITIGHGPLTLGLSRKRRGDKHDKHDCYKTRHKKLLVVLPFMLSERRFLCSANG